MNTVAVTGFAVHIPGMAARDLPGAPDEPAVGPDQAHLVLGRKGLLAKEPATRLALCAVHTALGLPTGKLTAPVPGAAGTAVVVASNLGNVETVCDVVDQMRADGGHAVSPLIAPNASSNIIASSIAIKYGFTGPNFMVCSGATAGLDAVRLGSLLVRAGRTHRAVVVGVEPDDPIAGKLAPGIRASAACVLLEADGDLRIGPVARVAATTPLTELETYGAQGVVEVAVAAAMLRADPARGEIAVSCGDPADGYASARVSTR